MNRIQKDLNILRSYIIGWFFANIILYLSRYVHLGKLDIIYDLIKNDAIIFLQTWIIQGIAYGLLFVLIDRFIKGKVGFFKLQFYALLLQVLAAIILTFLLFEIFIITNVLNSETTFLSFLEEQEALGLAFIFALLVNFIINLVLYIDISLGSGNLLKMIKGTFYAPKETDRIFMFIDLKGSTTLAEKLGHTRYSEFIQDCFYDIAIVDQYKAKIYQYVGDEAVLTWSMNGGVQKENCINAFFAFKKRLQDRSSHYLSKYGAIPEFKAGMNSGKITITEVGELKKEIAYHGDTINIAARLQVESKRLDKDLIISENSLHSFEDLSSFIVTPIGDIILKGKNKSIKIFSISEKEN